MSNAYDNIDSLSKKELKALAKTVPGLDYDKVKLKTEDESMSDDDKKHIWKKAILKALKKNKPDVVAVVLDENVLKKKHLKRQSTTPASEETLLEIATRLNIPRRTSLVKDELIQAIIAVQSGQALPESKSPAKSRSPKSPAKPVSDSEEVKSPKSSPKKVSAYNAYVKENSKSVQHLPFGERMSKLAQTWKSASSEEKARYAQIAEGMVPKAKSPSKSPAKSPAKSPKSSPGKLSGYNVFVQQLSKLDPEIKNLPFGERMKKLSELWKNTTVEVKAKYSQLGEGMVPKAKSPSKKSPKVLPEGRSTNIAPTISYKEDEIDKLFFESESEEEVKAESCSANNDFACSNNGVCDLDKNQCVSADEVAQKKIQTKHIPGTKIKVFGSDAAVALFMKHFKSNKCNSENDFKCDGNKTCDLDSKLCLERPQAGKSHIVYKGRTVYGSAEALALFKQKMSIPCDENKRCSDGKSCHIDTNQCVSEMPPNTKMITFNGYTVYGSEQALNILRNSQGNREGRIIIENVDDSESGKPLEKDDAEVKKKRILIIENSDNRNPKSRQEMIEYIKIVTGKSDTHLSKKSDVELREKIADLRRKYLPPNFKPIGTLKNLQSVVERKMLEVKDADVKPKKLVVESKSESASESESEDEVAVVKPISSLKSKQDVQKVIANIMSGKENVNNFDSVRKSVIECLGLAK